MSHDSRAEEDGLGSHSIGMNHRPWPTQEYKCTTTSLISAHSSSRVDKYSSPTLITCRAQRSMDVALEHSTPHYIVTRQTLQCIVVSVQGQDFALLKDTT